MARRRGPLVGRAAELAAFEQAWERVESGNRQAVFIGGEPGAGKTRLAAEVAGTLADHGVAVLVGSSTADADVPYAPFAEALDRLLIATPPGSIAEPLGDAGPQLRRLSTQVDRHLPDTGPVAGRRVTPAGAFRRADRLPAAPGDRSPDRVDPRRPALGAAAHPRDARTRADRLRRCPHAGGGHVPHDRAGPLRRAHHPAGRTAPVRRCPAPGSRRAGHRGDRRVREPNPAAGSRVGAHGRRLAARQDRRQSVLLDRTGQRPGSPGRAGHVGCAADRPGIDRGCHCPPPRRTGCQRPGGHRAGGGAGRNV